MSSQGTGSPTNPTVLNIKISLAFQATPTHTLHPSNSSAVSPPTSKRNSQPEVASARPENAHRPDRNHPARHRRSGHSCQVLCNERKARAPNERTLYPSSNPSRHRQRPQSRDRKLGRFLRHSRSQGEQVQSPAGHAASDTFKIES